MIHPDTELQFVNADVGHGVFATAFIPKGTILFARDQFDITITPEQFAALDDLHRPFAEKYAYVEPDGVRVVCWDNAKYINHCCNANMMSTGYGFEIAVRDIQPGDQLVDDYGLFNLDYSIELSCGESCCRKKITPQDIDTYHPQWDATLRETFTHFRDVAQPLLGLVDATTRQALDAYLDGTGEYRSVLALKGRA